MAIKEDFKPVRASEHRVANRETIPIGTRFSPAEIDAISSAAIQAGVKKSDVVRSALVYVGVISKDESKNQ